MSPALLRGVSARLSKEVPIFLGRKGSVESEREMSGMSDRPRCCRELLHVCKPTVAYSSPSLVFQCPGFD